MSTLMTTLIFTTALSFAFVSTRWLGVIGVALLAYTNPQVVPLLSVLGLVIGGLCIYFKLFYRGGKRR